VNPDQIETILIAADDRAALQSTLAKAALIEHYTGATLRVAATFYDPIAEEPSAHFSPAETQAIIDRVTAAQANELAAQIAPFRQHVAELDSEVIWAKDAAAGLISEAQRIGASLLIKPRQPHVSLAAYLHAPVDWRLMRDAPCPVLFTSPKAWSKPAVILAALDPTDAGHTALNRTIIRYARQFQGVLGAELHLVTAYPELEQFMNQYQVATNFGAITQDIKRRRAEALESLAQEHGLKGARLHVVEGRPSAVIRLLATELDAALVVLGTAARTGLGRVVIGNTAEDISRHIATDLLTVREA
jgi:universal stress protein E